MQDQLHLLKSKRFAPLFATQFLGAFNDNVFKNALVIWMTFALAEQHDMNATILVNAAAGLFILPFFLFSALAGQLADKYEKSMLIRRIKLCEIILMILAATGFYLENVYFLLAVLFFMGTQSAFFGPLKYSILPNHLKDDELISGNALIEAGTFLSILLGTIFSGTLILTDPGVGIIAITIIILASVGYLSSRAIPLCEAADRHLVINKNFLSETWRLISYAKSHDSIWLCMLGISWFWFVGATFLTQFSPYVKTTIHGNEHVITLFLTLFSIGIALGSMLCNKLLKGRISASYAPLGCILISLFTIDFYFASNAYSEIYSGSIFYNTDHYLTPSEFLNLSLHSIRITADLLFIAFASGIYIVPLYAIMQHRADKAYLSRVIASNNILNALFMVGSALLTIVLFSFDFTIEDIFLLTALLNGFVYFIVKRLVKLKTPTQHAPEQ